MTSKRTCANPDSLAKRLEAAEKSIAQMQEGRKGRQERQDGEMRVEESCVASIVHELKGVVSDAREICLYSARSSESSAGWVKWFLGFACTIFTLVIILAGVMNYIGYWDFHGRILVLEKRAEALEEHIKKLEENNVFEINPATGDVILKDSATILGE